MLNVFSEGSQLPPLHEGLQKKTDCKLLNVTILDWTLFLAYFWACHKLPTEQHDLRTQIHTSVILRDI